MSTLPASDLVLVANDSVVRRPLAGTMWVGSGRTRGRVVERLADGGWRRAEQSSAGALVLEVRPAAERLIFQVWGPLTTPMDEGSQALLALRAWAGLDDDVTGFADLVSTHPVLSRAARIIGVPIIGALPRAGESFGRAVLGQLVQGIEAGRSTAQLVAMLGTPTPQGVWAYPTPRALGSAPAHELRRCGIALRSAGLMHEFARTEGAFQHLARTRDWATMDARIRRLRGAGVWTAAETRLYLGDADAVSYGDYHIPALVGWALGDRTETDQAMAELLAPYAPHRGRVIRLLEQASRRGLVVTKPRRGPRAALSAHRYW
ncbi:MAG: DNA-3-methyladenine glycosylase family protein [Euzebya sp.]